MLKTLNSFNLLFVIMLILGCGHSAPTNFYLLDSSLNQTAQPKYTQSAKNIGLGPIKIATYLDKPGIAIRDSQHQLRYADFNQWAEPLDDNAARVIRDNLSHLLPGTNIVHYPWRSRSKIDLQIKVDIIRFDTESNGDSILKAQWSIFNSDKRLIYTKTSVYYAQAMPANNYNAIATAMSQNLQKLSNDIAQRISPHST